MSIIYTLIARQEPTLDDDTILVEYTQASGNFPQLTRNFLKKIKQIKNKMPVEGISNSNQQQQYQNDIKKIENSNKLTLQWNAQYQYHYIQEGKYTFLCLTETPFSKSSSFAFLEDINNQFFSQINEDQREKAIMYSLNSLFTHVIKQKMNQYNTDPDADKLKQLKSNLNEIKEIMVDNIDKILDREEKIELLVKKTQTTNAIAIGIKQQAKQIKKDAYWRSIRVKVFIFILIAAVVGGGLFLI